MFLLACAGHEHCQHADCAFGAQRLSGGQTGGASHRSKRVVRNICGKYPDVHEKIMDVSFAPQRAGGALHLSTKLDGTNCSNKFGGHCSF